MGVDFSLVKKHPLATAGVLAGVFAVVYFAANSGGGTSMVTLGPSDAQVAAGNAASDNQAALVDAGNNRAFQLAFLQQQQMGDFAMGKLQGDISTTQQTNAIVGQIQLATIAANVNLAGIAAQTGIADLTLNIQNAINTNNNALQAHITDTNAATSIALSTIASNSAISMNATNTAAFITNAQINAAVTLGLGDYSNQQQLAEIGAFKDVTIAQINASKSASKNNLLGTALNALTHFF